MSDFLKLFLNSLVSISTTICFLTYAIYIFKNGAITVIIKKLFSSVILLVSQYRLFFNQRDGIKCIVKRRGGYKDFFFWSTQASLKLIVSFWNFKYKCRRLSIDDRKFNTFPKSTFLQHHSCIYLFVSDCDLPALLLKLNTERAVL